MSDCFTVSDAEVFTEYQLPNFYVKIFGPTGVGWYGYNSCDNSPMYPWSECDPNSDPSCLIQPVNSIWCDINIDPTCNTECDPTIDPACNILCDPSIDSTCNTGCDPLTDPSCTSAPSLL